MTHSACGKRPRRIKQRGAALSYLMLKHPGQMAACMVLIPVLIPALIPAPVQPPIQIRIGMTTYLKSGLSGTVISAEEFASPRAMLMLSHFRLFKTSSK